MAPGRSKLGKNGGHLQTAISAGLLATSDNYPLTRKNASFDLDNKILLNPLGERIDRYPHRPFCIGTHCPLINQRKSMAILTSGQSKSRESFSS
jgi:hypothetical protein